MRKRKHLVDRTWKRKTEKYELRVSLNSGNWTVGGWWSWKFRAPAGGLDLLWLELTLRLQPYNRRA